MSEVRWLTILSVLAGWSLLATLVSGLLRILNRLYGIRQSLEKITWGVRAIEQQTAPLRERADTLAGSLAEAGPVVGAGALRLREVTGDLETAVPLLRPPQSGEEEAHA